LQVKYLGQCQEALVIALVFNLPQQYEWLANPLNLAGQIGMGGKVQIAVLSEF
jgi:hypothetical protein